MRANDLILELLRTSQKHIDNATDPDTPEALFKPYLHIGALAGQAAFLLDAALKRDPGEADILAAEVGELAIDGEVLVSWVGERLNTWKERCQDCGLPFDDGPGRRDTRHDHCGQLPHTGPVGGPYCEKCG